MNWWQRLWRRKQMEEELEKELRFHLDAHVNELIAQGYAPDLAQRVRHLLLAELRPLRRPASLGIGADREATLL